MTMALLASSPQVALGRVHPYEHRYLAWFIEWAALVDRPEWNTGSWDLMSLALLGGESPGDGLIGPPPWWPRPLLEDVKGGASLGPRLLRSAWREFSLRAVERTRNALGAPRAHVRYCAEKAIDIAHLRERSPVPVRGIILHRDPRDVWLSVQAFDRARGFYGFGRTPDESEERWFERFLGMHTRRLNAALEERDRPSSLLLAYEQLVTEPGVAAERLGAWLGVELDPLAPRRDLELHLDHSTSVTPGESIGRWRRELEPSRQARFLELMGPQLRELGYES